uniref:EOG090X0154 n=1 Tax=Evadne anonyx TaxID=141404 RepID=A0A9N6ZF61_9CRUS|nr:EOG090X0154 [Evadne anonyx]
MENSKIRQVSPRVFQALQNMNVENLLEWDEEEIRPIMPCLTRMSLLNPLDQSHECSMSRRTVFKILSSFELVNSIVGLLSIDFHALEVDVKKEQLQRQKMGMEDSALVQSLENGYALEFERSVATRKLRLFLNELLTLLGLVKDVRPETGYKSSELLDQEIYFEEIADVLCVVMAELPVLLPVTDVAEALLRTLHGPSFICRMVANMPDTFYEVCCSLISNGERYEEETFLGRARLETLRSLCRLCPNQILLVRTKCVELCRMPALAVLLSLDYAKNEREERKNTSTNTTHSGDVVPFISGLLLGSDLSIRNWFSLFIRNGQKRHERTTALQTLREELLKSLQVFVKMAEDEPLPDRCAVEASTLLRLYCALKGIAGMKIYDEEGSFLLELITCRPPPTEAGLRFVALGLCMLMACPSLITLPDQEQRGFQWIKWLVREVAYFEKSSSTGKDLAVARSSFGEMLLLMAIHFHSGQLSAVNDLVCSTLGMRLLLRPATTARMKQAFTQEIFPEQVVTSHAVRVPVTPALTGDVSGFLPVHCIYQLLKSRAFSKHRVPIKTWIYRQICESRPPLHPLLPSLVEVYVNSILTFTSKNTNQTVGMDPSGHDPITEEEIRPVFSHSFSDVDAKDGQYSVTAQLLLLYYVLLYEDTRLAHVKNYLQSGITIHSYSQTFFAELPIRYLISQAGRQQHLYGGLFSPLLRLIATHFPQLCLVEDWIYETDDSQFSSMSTADVKHGSSMSFTSQAIEHAFSNLAACPAPALLLMRKLRTLPPKTLWPLANAFISRFRSILDDGVPRQVQDMYRQVWLRLNSVFPRQLWVMTVNAIRLELSLSEECPPPTLTQDHLIFDPLHVLRCDLRVFRCPPVMQIVVYMLKAWLGASRTHLSRHLLEKPLIGPVASQGPGNLAGISCDSEREELKTALIATQESAVVQIVLEICLETEEDKGTQKLSEQREIQSIVCSFLHQLFIADPNLVKLVHFQGYPSALLPLTTQGIPSMHICLDFLPELLAQPILSDLSKQLFAVDLISYLSLQYALPKSFNVARLAVNTLSTLLSVLPTQGRTEIYLPSLPALVRIATAFPPLLEDIISFLVQLGRICLSQSCLHGSYDHRIVSSMLKQMDGDGSEEENPMEKEEICTSHKEEETIKPEPMEIDLKKDREEGELEEGELPDNKSLAMTTNTRIQSMKAMTGSLDLYLETVNDGSTVPFSAAQVRELFKVLPESSLMGAEVYRTFSLLCSRAILHKKVY